MQREMWSGCYPAGREQSTWVLQAEVEQFALQHNRCEESQNGIRQRHGIFRPKFQRKENIDKKVRGPKYIIFKYIWEIMTVHR